MNRKLKAAAVFAALLTICSLSACGGEGSSPAGSTGSAENSAETTAVTETTAAETTTETTAFDSKAAKAEIAGKWEMESQYGKDVIFGQYGSEKAGVLYQIELNENGKAVYRDGSLASETPGRWSVEGDKVTTRFIGSDNTPKPNQQTEYVLRYDGEKLLDKQRDTVWHRVDSFSKPANPDLYALAGFWRCEEIHTPYNQKFKEDDDYGGAPVNRFGLTISAFGDTAPIYYRSNIDYYQMYFTSVSRKKEDKFTVNYEPVGDDQAPNYNNSEMWLEDGKLIWDVHDGIVGQYIFKRVTADEYYS